MTFCACKDTKYERGEYAYYTILSLAVSLYKFYEYQNQG